jgi:hypothetical protein
VGLRAGLDTEAPEKKSCALPGIEPRSSSLYILEVLKKTTQTVVGNACLRHNTTQAQPGYDTTKRHAVFKLNVCLFTFNDKRTTAWRSCVFVLECE